MGEKNGWKEREKREIEKTKDPSPEIKKNVKGTHGLFRLLTEFIELYLSKVIDTLLSLIGGSKSKHQDKNK